MIKLKALALGSIVALSSIFGTVGAAEARTPWIFVGESNSGLRFFVKDIHRSGTIVKFTDSNGILNRTNCQTGESWIKGSGGKWNSVGYYLPGSIGESEYHVVCNGYRPRI